jgi:hypothetical protein
MGQVSGYVENVRIAELKPGDVLSNGFTVKQVRHPAMYETAFAVDLIFTNGVVHYGHDMRGLTERMVTS